MLRSVLFFLSLAALALGALCLIVGADPPAFTLLIWGAILLAAIVYERYRYKPLATISPGAGWQRTSERFVDPADMRHDMHVTIVTLKPGAVIPFAETHVMEHGLYVLEGKAVYRLNQDWVEVEAGDFMWLRAFCPQACYAGGPGNFRYLLYKDVNRHAKLGGAGIGGHAR